MGPRALVRLVIPLLVPVPVVAGRTFVSQAKTVKSQLDFSALPYRTVVKGPSRGGDHFLLPGKPVEHQLASMLDEMILGNRKARETKNGKRGTKCGYSKPRPNLEIGDVRGRRFRPAERARPRA
jgi:hypothetical protein